MYGPWLPGTAWMGICVSDKPGCGRRYTGLKSTCKRIGEAKNVRAAWNSCSCGAYSFAID